MPRDPKITPITRNEPRTFYATRVTRTASAEVYDLWTVEDGRRVGYLNVVDDGHVVYALAAVKPGTDADELAELIDGLYGPSASDAAHHELVLAEYEREPQVMTRQMAE